MGFLIDTNVLSEMRKGTRGNPGLIAWTTRVPLREMFLSVLVLGEVRRGIEGLRGRDAIQAVALEAWLDRTYAIFANNITARDAGDRRPLGAPLRDRPARRGRRLPGRYRGRARARARHA